MLRIRKKRLVVSALVATGLVVPAVAFATGNLAKTNDSYAVEETQAMKNAAKESGFSDTNLALWGCVVKGKYGDNAPQEKYEEPMDSATLGTISRVDCWGAGGTDLDINGSKEEGSAGSGKWLGIRGLKNLTFLQLGNYDFPSINLDFLEKIEEIHITNNAKLVRIGDPEVVGTNGPDSKINCSNTLKELHLSGNPKMAGNLDVSGYTNLTEISIPKSITGINASNTGLTGTMQWNDSPNLASVNVTGSTGITVLDLTRTAISSLDVSTLSSLTGLNANETNLTGEIDLSNNTNLKYAGLAQNKLTGVKLPSNCKLTALNVRDNSGLSSVNNINNCSSMESLAINGDKFTNETVNGFLPSMTSLVALKAHNMSTLTEVDISNNKGIKNLQLDETDHVITDVEPSGTAGNYIYDFSNYAFINDDATTYFENHDGYTPNGKKITVTNWIATGGYAQVQQQTNPTGNIPGAEAHCDTIEDNYKCNYSATTYFDNHYRVRLAEPGAPKTKLKLTFDANGGENAPSQRECTISNTCEVTIPANEKPNYANHNFLGWSTDKNAKVADDNYAPGKTINLTKDTVLYAVWANKDDVVLSFDANGGKDAPSSESCTLVNGSCETKVPETTPTRDGYVFKGWGLTDDAKEIAFKPGDTVTLKENLTLFAMWDKVGNKTAGTPDTGVVTQSGNSGLATIITAAPIIVLGALVGTKLYRGRKSHIKFD